jgi:SAM-dependent methyltransferase
MADDFIDPIVSFLVGATNGIAYKHLRGRLSDYPIPELRLPTANGKVLLDVGCNWGRWCIAAARLGYVPIGVDPSLGAVLAAKRVAAQLGLYIQLVVGDARFLPFPSDSMDFAFSYSVLQHFARADAISAVKEIGRVLKTGGMSLVQMPTVCGVRCLYHQARGNFATGGDLMSDTGAFRPSERLSSGTLDKPVFPWIVSSALGYKLPICD